MKELNRNIYRGILVISIIAVNVFVVFGISSVLAFLNTGADRSSMLHTEVAGADVYLPQISWVSLENPGRPMENTTLKEIQKNYLDAWYVRSVAYQSNDPYGIDDFYTDSSRVNLLETIAYNKAHGITIESTTLNHQPKLDFYSADGQLVAFTDQLVVEYQKVMQNNELVVTTRDTSAYQVVMLLEDGFWRIRHMVKTDVEAVPETYPGNSSLKVEGDLILSAGGEPFVMKGINYYPQDTPWDMYGEKFDPEIINNDFKKIRDAGLNSIRIFIPYEDFGKETVSENKLQKLEMVLNLAEKNKLKVVLTLFDFYGDYSVLDWSLTQRHAAQIVSRLKTNPAILAWDLKNEPDLDFESRGKENVIDWLSEMALVVRKFDPNHLITIGWSSPRAAVNLCGKVDFISFHYYLGVDEFETHYQALNASVPEKPILVGEFGLSSYRGFWNPFGYSEEQQAEYHKKMQAAFKKHNLAFLSWTLYDFSTVPESVVGKLPWRKALQRRFGFIDRRGVAKPAFEFISH